MEECPGPDSSVDFIFQEIKDRLSTQLHSVDMIDSKAGIMVGVAGVAAAAVLATRPIQPSGLSAIQWVNLAVIALLLILSLAAAVRSYWVQGWSCPPNPRTLHEKYGDKDIDVVKRQLISNYTAAIEGNDVMRRGKVWWLKAALVCFTLAIGWALVCKLSNWL